MELGTTFGRAARSRRGVAGIIVGLAGIGLAISSAFVGPSAGATGAVARGLAVSARAVSRLDSIAASFIRRDGSVRPDWVTAVLTTRARALELATAEDSQPSELGTRVYLITMKGSFAGYEGSGPPGSAAPAGSYLSIVVNARSFAVLGWGLSPHPPPIPPGSLGRVRYLRR